MDGKILEAKDVAQIATLPTLDEARAKIVGILSSPAQKFLSILLMILFEKALSDNKII